MNLKELFSDKSTKVKEKVDLLSNAVLNGEISVNEVIAFASSSKDPVKASCIESLEFASQGNPGIMDKESFKFVTESLSEKAPRIKWESAKVIGNTAKLFPDSLENAITKLIENTAHEGTVVRWSAAFALGEILNINQGLKNRLLDTLKDISEKEEKNSIKKIYQKAIKIAEK
ncbi:HEAT repeat protein [Chryseobacterium defluvii]|uniref:HEAT repeat protein n=1 Tax=Chryseobacterium defluvii TaxID=160396 RepID=A0A840KFJ2_9FLAO|nr:HEAT repeat domain-containing protein [Chryseobacterium defluvii]MBB4808131.1 HEAT repeat protein [Chryseobacterium defluvii]